MELDTAAGNFLGYVRPPSTIDPITGQVVLLIPFSQLRGTLFLPVLLKTTYVRNFDPQAQMWSSPFADAVDFGVAAPQWTRMLVALDDGQPAVPVASSPSQTAVDLLPPSDTEPSLAEAPTVETAPADLPTVTTSEPPATSTTYAVQSGDTLKSISAHSGASVPALIAANPLGYSSAPRRLLSCALRWRQTSPPHTTSESLSFWKRMGRHSPRQSHHLRDSLADRHWFIPHHRLNCRNWRGVSLARLVRTGGRDSRLGHRAVTVDAWPEASTRSTLTIT